MTRRELLGATGTLFVPIANKRSRSFWVFKLLNPRELIVYPIGPARLHCFVKGDGLIVEGRQTLRVDPDSTPVRIAGPAGAAVSFVLEVPGVIRRSYLGTFQITTEDGISIPVITMDCEVATGSIVQAELITWGAPAQALAAQAVAARSMTMAATVPRHKCADFCDTTHCQFLRSPAEAGSPAEVAAQVTSGMVLFAGDRVVAARYSAACGGNTDSRQDGDFQYTGVVCEVCREAHNIRRGHGLGLCQEGAIGLAKRGWTWRAILRKYYPNMTIGQAWL